MHQALCALLASMLLFEPVANARATAGSEPQSQGSRPQKPTLKEKILTIAPESYVEVCFLDKRKLRGRLGEITDEGFALQVAKGDKIQNLTIGFDQVKSVKVVEKKGTSTGRVLAYGLAGIGAFFVGLLIACVATGCGD